MFPFITSEDPLGKESAGRVMEAVYTVPVKPFPVVIKKPGLALHADDPGVESVLGMQGVQLVCPVPTEKVPALQ